VNDRAFGLESTGQYTFSGGAPLISGSLVPDVRGDLYCGQPDGTSPTLVAGTVTANVAGRRIGGLLQRGTPGVDPTQGLYFDSGAAANQSPGLSSAVTTNTAILYFLYLCLPYGLPRWAFYTPASSGARQPRSPKGIPIVSDVACDINGHAGSNVPLPTTLFGASATCDYFNAVCVAAVPRRYNGGTPWTLRGKRVSWSYQAKNGFPFFLNTAVPMNASSNGVVIEFDTSAAGTPLFPQCATSVRFLATWQLFPGSASAIGLHYNKTLVHGAGGTFYTRDTIAQGTVWLPSNYFDLTGISQTDSMWGDFPIANQMIGTPPNPSFFVFLYSGDSTVAIGNTGTGTAVMTLGTGSNTEGGFLGYENP
jgi:hypothetical protein